MITIANAFILVIVAAAAWLGLAAVVQKRTNRRDKKADQSSNAAS